MYELPDLPYPPEALEPHIDAKTMRVHHDAHHATYVDKLNAALQAHEINQPLTELLSDLSSVPRSIRPAVRNMGGGHLNHSLWWRQLSSEPGIMGAALHRAVEQTWESGTVEMVQELRDQGAGVFGSGWVWLSCDEHGKLQVEATQGQDNPLMSGRLPLMGIDVWEHAYYLCYQSRRPAYLEAVFNVIDWAAVSERYDALLERGMSALDDEL